MLLEEEKDNSVSLLQEFKEYEDTRDTFLMCGIVQSLPPVAYIAHDLLLENKEYCLNGLQDLETSGYSKVDEYSHIFKNIIGMFCILACIRPNAYAMFFAAQGGTNLGKVNSYSKPLEGLSYAVSGVTVVICTSAIQVFFLQPWIFDFQQDSSYLVGHHNYDGHNKTEATCLEMHTSNRETFNNVNMDIGLVTVAAAILIMFYKMLQIATEPRIKCSYVCAGEMLPMIPGMIYTHLQGSTPGVKQACLDGMKAFAEGLQPRDVSFAETDIAKGAFTASFATPLMFGFAILYGYKAGTILGSGEHLFKGFCRALSSLLITIGSIFLGSAGLPLWRNGVRDMSYADGYKLANFTFDYCDKYSEFSQPVSDAIDITTAGLTVSITAMITMGFLNGRKQQQRLDSEIVPTPITPIANRRSIVVR